MVEKIIGGIKRECYPLTEAQKVHLHTIVTSSYHHEVVNMGTGRYLQTDINQAALREALNRAVERCESMRVRFWKDPETEEIWQYITPYENEYFEYYDFSQWDEKNAHAAMDRWTHQPFDTLGGKLMRIVLITLPNGWNGYYMNIHHMIMDASSIITFTHDVLAIYCSLLYNLPYPAPMASYIKSIEKEFEYEAGCKRRDKDEAYWMKQLSLPEPIYTDFTGFGRLMRQRAELNEPNKRSALVYSPTAQSDTVTYDLDTNSTLKLIHFAEEHNTSVGVLILLALRTVLSKFNKNETDVTIRNFVSRRSTLLAQKSGGVRMHCFDLRTIIEPTEKVIDAIEKIEDEQCNMFRHADYPTLTYYYKQRLAYNLKPGEGYISTCFTYQPATLKSIVPYLRGIPYKSRWYSSGRNAQILYLTAMHRPGDGGLTFHFGYQTQFATEKEIEFFYYYLARVLFRSIENPDKTIGEIMDMV